MSKQVIYNEDYTVGYMPGISAIVSTEVLSVPRTTVSISKDGSAKELNPWGENNDQPQLVITDVRKDPEIGTLLDKQASLLYSSGLTWGIRESSSSKTLSPLPANIEAEVSLWCRRTNIKRYLLEAAKDLTWFNNVFVEIVLQADRGKVIQICTQAAEECRFGKQNPTNGKLEYCYVNAQWPDAKETDLLTKKLPVLDAYYSPAEQLRMDTRGLNYIYPVNYANPGNKFYQLPDWNSIRASGWLEVSQAIPTFKKALLKNQLQIKYHIKISDKYWELKFPGWKDLGSDLKRTTKEAELTAINDTLAGAEKAGKSLYSVFLSDLNAGKDNDLIKIEAIDDKLKDGQFLEDGKDASLNKQAAIGLHPALVGTMANNGMGGAGSNIREAYNLHVMTNRSRQDLLLEPLNNLVIEYNGWPENMEFAFNNQFMATLDAGRETTENKPA